MSKIVKCNNCKHIHTQSDRGKVTSIENGSSRTGRETKTCPKCKMYYYSELSPLEYEMEVSKQQAHYPALKDQEIRPDWILQAYNDGVSPVQFLNGLLK